MERKNPCQKFFFCFRRLLPSRTKKPYQGRPSSLIAIRQRRGICNVRHLSDASSSRTRAPHPSQIAVGLCANTSIPRLGPIQARGKRIKRQRGRTRRAATSRAAFSGPSDRSKPMARIPSAKRGRDGRQRGYFHHPFCFDAFALRCLDSLLSLRKKTPRVHCDVGHHSQERAARCHQSGGKEIRRACSLPGQGAIWRTIDNTRRKLFEPRLCDCARVWRVQRLRVGFGDGSHRTTRGRKSGRLGTRTG